MDIALSKNKDSKFAPTAPTPTYPPLHTKPCLLKSGPSIDFQLIWKEDFLMYLQESPYYLSNTRTTPGTEKPEFNYKHFPAILRQGAAVKRQQSTPTKTALDSSIKKIKKEVDVVTQLKKLEEKEKNGDVAVKEEVQSETEEAGDEIEAEDMEMDDENDYGQNYFYDGEGEDDDDGGDDGPVF